MNKFNRYLHEKIWFKNRISKTIYQHKIISYTRNMFIDPNTDNVKYIRIKIKSLRHSTNLYWSQLRIPNKRYTDKKL